MKKKPSIFVVIGLFPLMGCVNGGPRNYPDPVSVQMFVKVVDDVSLDPLSGANVYYNFRCPRRSFPFFNGEGAPLEEGVVTTDAFGDAVIDVECTISVYLRQAVLPGYLWVKEGAYYSERSGGWFRGISPPSFLVRRSRSRQGPIGFSPDQPFVFLMKKGAEERRPRRWIQHDAEYRRSQEGCCEQEAK